VQQVVPKGEWPEVMDENGRLSASGLARVRNAIMVKAFGKSEATLRVIESPDDNMRRITNALVRVAPRVARAREAAEAGQIFPIEIVDDVVAAAEEIARLRAEGKSITQLLAQMTLVDRPYSDDTVEILQFLDDANRAGARLAAFINGYLDELEKYGPRGEDMFGEKPAPDKGAIARKKIKEVLDDEQRLSRRRGNAALRTACQARGRRRRRGKAGVPALARLADRLQATRWRARRCKRRLICNRGSAPAARGGEKVPDREVKKRAPAARGLPKEARRCQREGTKRSGTATERRGVRSGSKDAGGREDLQRARESAASPGNAEQRRR
jgi:hypothetical protein